MAEGDVIAGLLLSQIVYWNLPGSNGRSKLRVEKEDYYWLAKTYEEIWEEVRLKEDRARRAYKKLEQLGLIRKHIWKFNGAPTVHVRIYWLGFLDALESNLQNKPDDSIDRKSHTAGNESHESPELLTESTTESTSEITLEITKGLACVAEATQAPPNTFKSLFIDEMEIYFSQLIGINRPVRLTQEDQNEADFLWAEPLRRIADVVDFCTEDAISLISEAFDRLKLEGHTIENPRNVLGLALAIFNEWRYSGKSF